MASLLGCLVCTSLQSLHAEEAKTSSLHEAAALTSDFARSAALYEQLAQADVDEIDGLVQEALSLAEPGARAEALSIIYGRFSDINPEAALAHFLSTNIPGGNEILWSLFFSWSKVDLEAAIRQCMNLSDPGNRRAAIRGIMAAHKDLEQAELGALARRLGTVAVNQFNQQLEKDLNRLAGIDPPAAMDEVMKMESPGRQDSWMSIVARKWGALDPLAALAFGDQLESWEQRRIVRDSVLDGLARENPEEVIGLIESDAFDAGERMSLIHAAFRSLASSDPHLALQQAQSLSRESERWSANEQILSWVAQSSVDDAFDLIDALLAWPDNHQVVGGALSTIVRADPERALNWAQAHSADSPQMYSRVLIALAESDPRRALDLVTQLPDSVEKFKTIQKMSWSIARSDPVLGATFLDSIPKGPFHLQMAQSMARSWYWSDSESAMNWLLKLDGRLQSQLLIEFASMAAQNDLAYAEKMLPDLPSAQVRRAWIAAIADRLARDHEPAYVIEWLEPYQDDPAYGRWMNQLLERVARTVPAEQAIQLAEKVSDPADYERAIGAIVNTWVTTDAPAAANWVMQEVELANRDELIKNVTGYWSAYDLKSAEQWVMRFKQSRERDIAFARMLENEYVSTQEADGILRKMVSPELQFSGLQSYLGILAQYDPDAAEVYLARQTITSDQKQLLLNVIEAAEAGELSNQQTVGLQ